MVVRLSVFGFAVRFISGVDVYLRCGNVLLPYRLLSARSGLSS